MFTLDVIYNSYESLFITFIIDPASSRLRVIFNYLDLAANTTT